MADLVYPAVVVRGLGAEVDEASVLEYVLQTIGREPELFQNGGPKVKVYRGDEGTSSALIGGIKLTLEQIRVKLAKGDHSITIETVDMGVNREENGHMTPAMLQLHNDLKKGQGFSPLINIFQKHFSDAIGGLDHIGSDVYFTVEWMNEDMVGIPGRVLSKGRAMIEEKECFQLLYQTRIEALQAITLLGKNEEFSFGGECIVSDDGKRSGLMQHYGLGVGDAILSIADLIDKVGYIPIESLNKRILDDQKINALKKEPCLRCGSTYKILGISADFNWLAGKCRCDIHKRYYGWNKEAKFHRLGLQNDLLESFEHCTRPNKTSPPYKLIRGQLPTCANVEEIISSSGSAYLSALQHERIKTHKESTTGRVKTVEQKETVKDDARTRVHFKITCQVQRTATWCEDGRSKLNSVLVIPEIRIPGDIPTRDVEITYAISKAHCWSRGTVHGVENICRDFARVTLIAELPPDRNISVGDNVQLVVKSPVNEKLHILNTLKQWQSFTHARKEEKHQHFGIVHEAAVIEYTWDWAKTVQVGNRDDEDEEAENEDIILYDEEYNESDYEDYYEVDENSGNMQRDQGQNKEDAAVKNLYKGGTTFTHKIMLLRVTTRATETWNKLKERLYDSSISADLVLKNKCQEIGTLGRIVGITDLDMFDMPQVAVEIVAVLPVDFFISDNFNTTLEEDDIVSCGMTLWMLRPQILKKVEHQNIMPAGYFEADENDENHIDLKTDEQEEADYEEPVDGDEDDGFADEYDGVDVYYEDYMDEQNPDDLSFIHETWRERPATDLSIFDYFLQPSEYVKHSPKITKSIKKRTDSEYINKIPLLNRKLNILQKEAIKKMKSSRLSSTQGPPGTGKTHTAAMGIANLHLEEEGLTIVCAPSNYAAEVLYQKIVNVNKENGLKMKIVRMMAHSKESKSDDPNSLHVLIRKHKLWGKDPEIAAIIKKESESGSVELTHEERKRLKAHKNYISKLILAWANVVVCTVGCVNDVRLPQTVKLMKRIGRPLLALVCDESSLLTIPSMFPLLYLDPARIWLLGDFRQLRPTVMDFGAKDACLNISWMEMLLNTDYFRMHNVFTMLRVQYRMSQPIARVISSFMYDNQLISSPEVTGRKYGTKNLDLIKEFPEMNGTNIAFYNYTRNEERPDGASVRNPMEVDITRDILLRLADAKVDMKQVAIISMYAAQVKHLKSMMARMDKKFKDVEVATIDSYQGKEGRFIIINTVRANRHNNIGFLADPRRLNVGLSRAQDYMFIVGHVMTLRKSNVAEIVNLLELIASEDAQCLHMYQERDQERLNRSPSPLTTVLRRYI